MGRRRGRRRQGRRNNRKKTYSSKPKNNNLSKQIIKVLKFPITTNKNDYLPDGKYTNKAVLKSIIYFFTALTLFISGMVYIGFGFKILGLIFVILGLSFAIKIFVMYMSDKHWETRKDYESRRGKWR